LGPSQLSPSSFQHLASGALWIRKLIKVVWPDWPQSLMKITKKERSNSQLKSKKDFKNANSKKQIPKCIIDRLQNTDFKYRVQKSIRKYLWWASLKTARRQKPSIRTKRPPREKSARVVMLYKRRPRTSGWGLLGAFSEPKVRLAYISFLWRHDFRRPSDRS
jgi:hypothetical protein